MDELIVALVAEHQEQYVMDAHFHHTINTLAQMLPLWVGAIAANCNGKTTRQNEVIEWIEKLH